MEEDAESGETEVLRGTSQVVEAAHGEISRLQI